MLSLDRFKEIISTIQEHEKDSEILTKIMVKSSVGIIDYGFDITTELVKLLEYIFDDKDEMISWWLYEDVDKIIYFKKKDYDLDLTNVEDLYYYLIKQENKIKRIKKCKD